MLSRLVSCWVYGGTLAGILLLILAPLFARYESMAWLAIYLHLPIYMLHQFEEHDRDRFRTEFNRSIGGGREVLSPLAVFITNVPGVWLVLAASLYLATYVSLGWGLISVYLVLLNSIAHIVQAVRNRTYNPGLVSAVILFLPLSLFAMFAISRTNSFVVQHIIGLGLSLIIHSAILVHVRMKLLTSDPQANHGA